MNEIKQYTFNDTGIELIRNEVLGKNWPVVYILNGRKEAYVGETTSAYKRMKQHKKNPIRNETS